MKKTIFALLIASAIFPAQAQLFSRDSLGGAVVGGIAGGIIGHNSGRRTAEGIGIGAGAGLLLGALTSQYRRDYYGYDTYDYGYGAPYRHQYRPSRPNYAVTGAILGGVAGGVIGHNQGRHTAEGLAIGAGAGLLLGGIAEHEMRKREALTPYARPVYAQSRPVVVTQPATMLTTTPVVSQAQQPQQVTIINNYYGSQTTPMSSANALFGR